LKEDLRMRSGTITAARSGTFALGGDLPVHRLGFGAMRVTGPGVWGPPADKKEALAVLRRAVELEVNLIDTAESYGPHVSEELIAAALHPYAQGLVIATKGGLDRPGPHKWQPDGRPQRLREELEGSLRRLRRDRIDLWQLHRIDPAVPEEEQFGAMQAFQREGKVRHLGLSEASLEQIQRARAFFPVVSVQNRYNLVDREWNAVVDYCDREGIAFIPWFPLQVGKLAEKGGALVEVARELGATPSQVGLAWLLRRSRVMLPIPGTSHVSHLDENVAAAGIDLSKAQLDRLGAMGGAPPRPG
jgi:aryl-alcohol dehydrogenase-like predicted oxidoreductase